MNNLYLFTGENHYELRQELKRRKENFAQKFWAESIFAYNSENRTPGGIKQNLFGGGLFVTKKLIILFGLPLDSEPTNKLKEEQYGKLSEEIMAMKSGIPADTIMICVAYKSDKRGRFYKWITKEGQTKEFWMLTGSALKAFVKQQAEGLGMDDDVISTLLLKVWTDQFRLVSEIEKLRYRKERNASSQLSSPVVEDITFGMVEANSFKFFDHIFTSPHEACKILDDIQSDGTDRNQTSGMLYRGLKNYLIVLDFHRQGITDAKTIASEAKLNPYSLFSPLKQIDTLLSKEPFIKNFFKKLIELDYDIKMGHLPAEYFWLAVKELVLKG